MMGILQMEMDAPRIALPSLGLTAKEEVLQVQTNALKYAGMD